MSITAAINEGQADSTPETGTSIEAPAVNNASDPAQTTDSGLATNDQTDSESFFDPNDVSEELMPAYKQMQAAFTRKMQAIQPDQQKIAQYDAFMADPASNLRQLAQQYGINLGGQQSEQTANDEFDPQTWDDVFNRFSPAVKSQIMQELQPVLDEVKNVKRQNIEQKLNSECPDWRLYETEMRGLLQKHPTLANDPTTLYNMALPEKVRFERATKAALAKLNGQTNSARTTKGSSTTRTNIDNEPAVGATFNDCVEFARAKIAPMFGGRR